MKFFDYAALLAAVMLTVFFLISAFSKENASLEILIETDGREWIYPIDIVKTQDFEGPVGHTIVNMDSGVVSIISSDCSEQICVQSGSISKSGQWIACMPNRLFVTIRGKKEGELDGEAY